MLILKRVLCGRSYCQKFDRAKEKLLSFQKSCPHDILIKYEEQHMVCLLCRQIFLAELIRNSTIIDISDLNEHDPYVIWEFASKKSMQILSNSADPKNIRVFTNTLEKFLRKKFV